SGVLLVSPGSTERKGKLRSRDGRREGAKRWNVTSVSFMDPEELAFLRYDEEGDADLLVACLRIQPPAVGNVPGGLDGRLGFWGPGEQREYRRRDQKGTRQYYHSEEGSVLGSGSHVVSRLSH